MYNENRNTKNKAEDQTTADAFVKSWNNLPLGSIYSYEQFADWIEPLVREDIHNKRILELGCGNGSLMIGMAMWNPEYLLGVDLGDSVESAKKNLENIPYDKWKVIKGDLLNYKSDKKFDLVYCIGVLHHLKQPKKGLDAVILNTKPGGKFHCWVYAYEGNAVIRHIIDPIRKLVHRLPWWAIKYLIATPLVVPYYVYAKIINRLDFKFFTKLPLYKYSLWIANREFYFFRHVAFDQLVTPQTAYIKKKKIENWLKTYPEIDPQTAYIEMRNGNSWKFGGEIKYS